ncbi:molybdate ABC transporter permease subunit [Jhaorihella thermophila]
MDWQALRLSLALAAWTVVLLLPVSVIMGRFLGTRSFRGKGLVEGLVMLPLVLPPTVFGFYLLVLLGRGSPIGAAWQDLFGRQLVFTFEGLVLASVLFNLSFAIQPAQRAFEAIPTALREAAASSGMSPLRALWAVELPLAWPGGGHGNGADLCPYAGRIRGGADGGRRDSRRDTDHRDCDL